MPITADLSGRPYATVAEVEAGALLEADGGFTCVNKGDVLTVERDEIGLFVPCSHGQHYLDGQINEDRVYVGLHRAEVVVEADAA